VDKNEFWERIKDLIRQNNTHQEWVAGKCGVSKKTFQNWSHRKIVPNIDQGVFIAQALETTAEYLVTGSPPEGISPDILTIARKIALLPTGDREELLAIAELKLAKLRRAEEEIKTDKSGINKA
jgi:transcriptional regulator with XRE-family HTH domain